jgi:putative transposase
LGATLTDAKHKRNDVLVAAIAEDLTLRAMGVDFGVRNTAALAFNTGDRSIVVGAGRLEAHLKVFDDKLDAMASRLTTPELRELQARKTALQKLEPPQKLPRADETTLRKGLKALYAVPEFKVLRQQRERWLADYVHKLSRGVVEVCRERHIEVLVLGKNTGWKDGMNMGRVQNRRFGNVPIARLIEQIRYKAESLGMVVVTTEESYTSKSSFANNEELKVYSKEGREDKKKSKDPVAAPGAPESSLPCGKAALTPVDAQASTPPRPKVKRTKRQGRRLTEDRNTFLNYHQTGRWARVHADVNGAFNMLRKVFKGFKCHEHLSSKHTVMRISPRLGLTTIKSLG